jgi:acyl carrier protein
MQAIEVLKQFIKDELVPNLDDLDEKQSLLEGGILDSLRIMKLVTFIETKFDMQVTDEELVPDNFETLISISELISNKHKTV